MSNPYDPPTQLDVASVPNSVPKTPPGILILCYVSGAVGIVIGLHGAVAIEEGIGAALSRTTNNPANAVVFFGGGTTVCMATAIVWQWLRRRWFRDFQPNPLSRFLMGITFALTLYFLAESLGDSVEGLIRSGGPNPVTELLLGLIQIGWFLMAIVISIEIEAVWRAQVRT